MQTNYQFIMDSSYSEKRFKHKDYIISFVLNCIIIWIYNKTITYIKIIGLIPQHSIDYS